MIMQTTVKKTANLAQKAKMQMKMTMNWKMEKNLPKFENCGL